MKKIIPVIIFLFFSQINLYASVFDDLNKKKTSYLDFVLLKIEQRLAQRHGYLGRQPVAFRVQYENVGSQIDFSQKDSEIVISLIGVMDRDRYTKKKYEPKLADCNVLRNILLYGKYGYNIFQKRNRFLTNADMEEIFLARFLNNLSLSKEEKEHILNHTIVKVSIKDPVRGNDIFCKGKVAEDLR